MPQRKSTKNMPEIGKFITRNDAGSAMFNNLRANNSLQGSGNLDDEGHVIGIL